MITKRRLLSLAIVCLVTMFCLCIPLFAQTTHSVTLTWQASTTPSVSYNVYRETTAGACTVTTSGTGPGCLRLNATVITGLTWTDSIAPIGTSFYVVRSVSGTCSTYPCANESANSNEVSVLLQAAPIPPVLNPPVVR
jgi:hypothetical protein